MKINSFEKVTKAGHSKPEAEVIIQFGVTEFMALMVGAYGNPAIFQQLLQLYGTNSDIMTQITEFIEKHRYDPSISLQELSPSDNPDQMIYSSELFRIWKNFNERAVELDNKLK